MCPKWCLKESIEYSCGHGGLSPMDRHFQRAFCLVLIKNHGINLIYNTSWTFNRLCFTKTRKWKLRANGKLIGWNCLTFLKHVFIHGVWLWLLGTSLITSQSRKHVCGAHRLSHIHTHVHPSYIFCIVSIPVVDSFWCLAKLIQCFRFKNKIKLKKKNIQQKINKDLCAMLNCLVMSDSSWPRAL